MISPGAGVKNIQNPPRAPGSGHRSHDQTPLPLPLPGAQQPESQQPEGEETVADLTCPPRPFTHCLPQPGILSRVPSWAISRRGLHNRRRGLCLCRRAKRAARQLLAVLAANVLVPIAAQLSWLEIHSASATDCRRPLRRRRRGRGIRPSAARLGPGSGSAFHSLRTKHQNFRLQLHTSH